MRFIFSIAGYINLTDERKQAKPKKREFDYNPQQRQIHSGGIEHRRHQSQGNLFLPSSPFYSQQEHQHILGGIPEMDSRYNYYKYQQHHQKHVEVHFLIQIYLYEYVRFKQATLLTFLGNY